MTTETDPHAHRPPIRKAGKKKNPKSDSKAAHGAQEAKQGDSMGESEIVADSEGEVGRNGARGTNKGPQASAMARTLKSRLTARQLAMQIAVLDDEDKQNQQDAQNVISIEDLITKADKDSLQLLRDAVRGLIPGITTAQRLEAGKQIRQIVDDSKNKLPSDFLQQLGAGTLKEAIGRLEHQKGKVIDITPQRKANGGAVLE